MQLEKAWDLKALGAELKAAGLIEAEQAAEVLFAKVADFVKASAELEQNALIKGVVSVAFGYIEPKVKEGLDKIDGQPG